MSDTQPTDFFVTTAPLKSNAPSYVQRPADEVLYWAIKHGEFCYVLTAPQMGKTSLMLRTAHRLQSEGIKTAVIALSRIDSVTPDQWYVKFLSLVATELDLDTDVTTWWQASATPDNGRRVTNFLHDIVLAQCADNVVIFVDEIECTLNGDFADDFFAAISDVYDNRTQNANFERLTFVVMGSALPSDLVKNQARTPFNMGRHINLNDFRWVDMRVLVSAIEAVYPQQGEAILLHAYRWTQGHPLLTQKLCKAIADAKASYWSEEHTDQVVDHLFLSQEESKEACITFVQHAVLNQANKRNLLNTYQQILRDKEVADDEHSPVINQLKLSGLVKAKGGYLHNRNEIYRQLFNEAWLKKNATIHWPLLTAVTFGLIAAALIIYLAIGRWQAATPDETASAVLTSDAVTPTNSLALSAVSPTATHTPPTDTPLPSTIISTTLAPTATNTPTPLIPLLPTETPLATPIATAVAIQQAIIFMAPDTRTAELGLVATDETVEVLGRSADRFGRIENKPGLYIRTSEGIEGFVVALFFDWPGDIDALPVAQPKIGTVAFNVFLFAEPDITSERVIFASAGEFVEIIARSGAEWFYVRTAVGSEGFAQRDYFDWRGDFDALIEHTE